MDQPIPDWTIVNLAPEGHDGTENPHRLAPSRKRANTPLLDQTAFTALVRQHNGAMVRVARCLVGSHAIAEEVAQDTWLDVITNAPRFAGGSASKHWIFACLVSRATTRADRESRIANFTGLESNPASESAPNDFRPDGSWAERPQGREELDPERIVAFRQLMAHVAHLLAGMPAAQRTIVVLRDFQGLPPADACRILGITAANQRVLLHRGRARIRNGLAALLAQAPGQGSLLSRQAI